MQRCLDTVEEFWNWEQVRDSRRNSKVESLQNFKKSFAEFIKVPVDNIFLMPSGHQGLEWLLKSRLDKRRIVMVPSFNCSVVQTAIEEAGHKIRLYDFSPNPGCFNWKDVINQMDDSVGVLIITHYFGVPVDFRYIQEYCIENDITIIEDCAHTLGGEIANQLVGTLGDAAIFSFNYDKPISLGWGGLAVVNNKTHYDITLPIKYKVPSIDQEMKLLHAFVKVMTARRKMIPYNNILPVRALRKMRLFKLPQFVKDQNLSIGVVQAELGRWCLLNYPDVLKKRIANAKKLANGIKYKTWYVGDDIMPAWLKQKCYIGNNFILKKVALKLQEKGLRSGNFNWPVLIGGDSKKYCINSIEAAELWMDVPIHQRLNDANLEDLIKLLK